MLGFLKKKKKDRKVLAIGLDCAAPELVFDRWRDQLPTLSRLCSRGIYGELDSCIPAITVPAWSSMLSSKDPGTLGIYGFRNRTDYSYDKMHVATGAFVKEKRVWDYISDAGKRSIIIGVPQTFPVKPINGSVVSSFLTPDLDNEFTFPSKLREDLLKVAPRYAFDVKDFRTDKKDWLIQQIWDMTEMRLKAVKHLAETEPWDFFMWTEIGVDRLHHGMWSYMDHAHRKYEAGNPYEDTILEYYKLIDSQVAEVVQNVDDDTVVMVLSDHGGKKMEGGVCINEWLVENGYLALKEQPPHDQFNDDGSRVTTRFEPGMVDWQNTIAWGAGGYYGRVFLNVEGREPMGRIRREDYEKVREELSEGFRGITDDKGAPMNTKVFKPQEIYHKVRGVPPDMMIYWDDLNWRSVGSFGHGGIHTFENDTGPDDANHAQNGMFILCDPRAQETGRLVEGRQLMDVAPTILEFFDQPVPHDMQGARLNGR